MNETINWLGLPAISGAFYNDVLSLISIAGSIILFLGSFPNSPFSKLTGLAEWHIAPLVFGTFFQISIVIIKLEPEKIGFLVPMSPGLVNGLFAASFLLLAGGWWVRRNQARYVE